MKFDRNTVMGFLALGVLFIAYFVYTTNEQQAFQKQKALSDSLARAAAPKLDTIKQKVDSQRLDSQTRKAEAGKFGQAGTGTEELKIVENDLIRIAFTNKGGQPSWVELKNFKNLDSSIVRLGATNYDRFSYAIQTDVNQTAQVSDLFFSSPQVSTNSTGGTEIVYHLKGADSAGSNYITHHFVLPANQYMLDFNVILHRASEMIPANSMNIIWQSKALQLEKDVDYEKQQSQIVYSLDGEFDYHTVGMRSSKELDDKVEWVAVKQQFFNTTLVAKNGFASGNMEWTVPPDVEKTVVQATAYMKHNIQGQTATIPFSLYYGPNDYKLLKSYKNEMENLVNLGTGIFAFVKYINRWIVLPVFDLLSKFVSSYGIVILLLTVFIRLLISPLTYTSYLSGAKMKALRPEIELLKKKYGTDQQQISMEQMKLFREAGVNPLGGCIPALLQIPIFFALYAFFSSAVELRGESFLWANDLSAYDSVLNFGFHIPFYGSHVSLFTITAVITSFLISIYSMSLTPDQNNPVLKWMPYIFPFFLLFIFNRLPSSLTWYYTVSNLITLALQFIIQNYIIDHDKILAKIQDNRKKPKTKSKWAERLEQMQEQQKKMKDTQQKSKR